MCRPLFPARPQLPDRCSHVAVDGDCKIHFAVAVQIRHGNTNRVGVSRIAIDQRDIVFMPGKFRCCRYCRAALPRHRAVIERYQQVGVAVAIDVPGCDLVSVGGDGIGCGRETSAAVVQKDGNVRGRPRLPPRCQHAGHG